MANGGKPMKRFLETLKKNALLPVLILCLTYYVLLFIAQVGEMGDGNASIVFGSLLLLAVEGLLFALLAVFLLKKNHAPARYIGILLLSYYAISQIFSVDQPFNLFFREARGTTITDGVFMLLAELSFLTAMVMFLLTELFPKIKIKNLDLVLLIILLFWIFFTMMVFIFDVIRSARAMLSWYSYFNTINNCLVLPCLFFFGFLLYRKSNEEPEAAEPASSDSEETIAKTETPEEQPVSDQIEAK